MAFFSGKFRLSAASHVISSTILFETFLFTYLTAGLCLQNINIYKTNLHLIDYNLLLFVILLLSRRLIWAIFQTIQPRVQSFLGWNSHYWFASASTVALIGWVVTQLLQKASLFNLLFLFYPVLVYLSLFGFTLDPRAEYRQRYSPPNRFLNHVLNRNLAAGMKPSSVDVRQFLLPVSANDIRAEVSVLLADLLIRVKQLLFNALLCAYYVGFIPMQFTPSHIYFDKWWNLELTFFIWANSFVILSCLFLPPNYCDILHQCALHLGCWVRCNNIDKPEQWSAEKKWSFDSIVEWNNECFKGEGIQNVAVPCDSAQECFYLLFNSRLHIISWLLALQIVIVLFELVVLLRVSYWYQMLTISIFLIFNYFLLHRLLYNRLLFGKLLSFRNNNN